MLPAKPGDPHTEDMSTSVLSTEDRAKSAEEDKYKFLKNYLLF